MTVEPESTKIRQYKNSAVRMPLWFLLALIIAQPLWALDELGRKKQSLTELQKDIQQVDQSVQALKEQQAKLRQLLKRQEKQYGVVYRQIRQLKQKIAKQRRRLDAIKREQVGIQSNIRREKKALESQIRAAYAMGDHERLKVMFNQQDPLLSSRILVYYDYLNKARLKKIAYIESQFRQLQQLRAEYQQKTADLANTLSQKKQDLAELKRLKQQRQQTLAKLKQQVVSKKAKLARMKEDARQLQELIARLQRQQDDFPFQEGPGKPFGQLKGRLPWPVHGKIMQKFGGGSASSHRGGVLIAAQEGSNVHAVTRGRVVYADWLRGYGLLTIIDHGQGFMTLYGFNQSLFKSKGDWVEAGDIIAAVGQSGGRSQSALYFAIRKKRKAIDPVRWCRKLRKGNTT